MSGDPADDGPRCRQCGGRLVWHRTPALPAPAGIWMHEADPDDDHNVQMPEGWGEW